jgi:hypothetical protein
MTTTTTTTTLAPRIAHAAPINGNGADFTPDSPPVVEPPKRTPRRLHKPAEPLAVDEPSKLSSGDAERLGRLYLEARRRGVEIEDLVREARDLIALVDRVGLGVLP